MFALPAAGIGAGFDSAYRSRHWSAPWEGKELRILNTEVVPILAYQHQILDPLYEEASGVTLIYENASHSDVLPRIQTTCAAQGDDFDIMFVEDGWAGALAALGCLEELDRFYLAAPGDSHPEDFTTRAFGTVAMAKEKWVGMPTLVAVGMFAYRTDLFGDPDEQAAFMDAYGRELTVPQTWDELAKLASSSPVRMMSSGASTIVTGHRTTFSSIT